jgi:hypothetical protein
LIPQQLLKDKLLHAFMHKQGLEAMRRLEKVEEKGHTETRNVQKICSWFKSGIAKEARKRERISVPRILKELSELQKELQEIQDRAYIDKKERVKDRALLARRIAALEQKHHKMKWISVQTHNRVEGLGESPMHYWTQLNQEKRPRDTIHALRVGTDPNTGDTMYENNSRRMANLAGGYHKNLQQDESWHPPKEWQMRTTELLDGLNTRLSDKQAGKIGMLTSREQVEEALKTSKSWSAVGIDSLTYELWKRLNEMFKADKDLAQNSRGDKTEPFDVIQLMTAAFNDIEKHGIAKGTNFAEG